MAGLRVGSVRVRTIAIFVIATVGIIAYWLFPSHAVRVLPASAEDVQEFYQPAFGNDYIRGVKARLPEEDFPVYAKSLGLNRRFDPTEHGKNILWPVSVSSIGFMNGPPWWNPPGKEEATTWFYDNNADRFERKMLTWYKGYVYYTAARG